MKTILKSLMAGLLCAVLALIVLKPEAQAQIKVVQAPTAVFKDYKAIELPEDGVKYFTTVFLPNNYLESAQCRQILGWFKTEPRLVALSQTTHYAIYTESDPMYQSRYKASVGKVPCVCVNDANGKTLFIARTFPQNGTEFASLISESVNSTSAYTFPREIEKTEGWRRDQKRQGVWNPNHKHGCPFPKPEPDSDPEEPASPEPTIQAEVIADTQPAKSTNMWLVLLGGIVGAGLSLVSEVKKEANKE